MTGEEGTPGRGESAGGARPDKNKTTDNVSGAGGARNGASSPLAAALEYAARGWRVLPLHEIDRNGECACGHECGRDAGKHPRAEHGVHDATTDERVIRQWWAQWPTANIGIATGRESGLLVFDVDPRNGGDATLAALEGRLGPLPDGPRVRTGSGGEHLYEAWPHGVGELLAKIPPGVDVQRGGQYVVVPPSIHVSGGRYEWMADGHPDDYPLPELPPAWLDAITRRPADDRSADPRPPCGVPLEERMRRARRYITKMPIAVSGQGGHAATWAVACVLVRGFMLDRLPAESIMREHSARCRPPWSEREIAHKLASAERARLPWGYLLDARLWRQTEWERLVIEGVRHALAR